MKKIIIIFICIYTIAFGTDIPKDTTSSYNIKSGVIEYQIAGGDEMGNVRVIFNNYGKKVRTAMHHNTLDIDMYTILNNGITYAVIDQNESYFKADNENLAYVNTDFSKLTSEKKEKILDKECDLYTIDDKQFWVWKGVVLKLDSKNDKEDLMAVSFQDVPTPPSAFIIPENYQEQTMPK